MGGECHHPHIKPMKEPEFVPCVLTNDQVKKLLKFRARRFFERRLQLLILILLDTGCRITEATGLKVSDVDMVNLLLTLTGTWERWSGFSRRRLLTLGLVPSSDRPSENSRPFRTRLPTWRFQLEAARLLTYRSAWRLGNLRNASLDACITELFISESLVRVAFDTVHIHGGYGFMIYYEVERALRDAIGSIIYSGTLRDTTKQHRSRPTRMEMGSPLCFRTREPRR